MKSAANNLDKINTEARPHKLIPTNTMLIDEDSDESLELSGDSLLSENEQSDHTSYLG